MRILGLSDDRTCGEDGPGADPARTDFYIFTNLRRGENCRDGGTKTDLRSISRCVPIPRWKVFFYELVCANKATDQCEC